MMNTNIKSVIALSQLVVSHLEKTKGVIVNVSSVGAFKASPVRISNILLLYLNIL